jgi:hypothetical protein
MEPDLSCRVMRVVAMMAADLERQRYLIERSELMLRDADRRLWRWARTVQPETDPSGAGRYRVRA